jgi:hypothetical protein
MPAIVPYLTRLQQVQAIQQQGDRMPTRFHPWIKTGRSGEALSVALAVVSYVITLPAHKSDGSIVTCCIGVPCRQGD